MNAPNLGARLREAREVLGLKQEDAAAALGIPRSSVSALEGNKRNVNADELRNLAQLYRRSVDWLLGQEVATVGSKDALFRATERLTEDDQLQVLRFAEFLASAGPAPTTPPADAAADADADA